MAHTLTDLMTLRPKFVGQKVYCNETARWHIAKRSCNGYMLVWAIN